MISMNACTKVSLLAPKSLHRRYVMAGHLLHSIESELVTEARCCPRGLSGFEMSGFETLHIGLSGNSLVIRHPPGM